MKRTLADEVAERGVTRLCHLTSTRNLLQIVGEGGALLCTDDLHKDERRVFQQTDTVRLDHLTSHICCSVEYPNSWFMRKGAQKDQLFKDWVVLFISLRCLYRGDTYFCPANAASHAPKVKGVDGFVALYEPVVIGGGGRPWKRSPTHMPACPTDNQAEVLVPGRIEADDIPGMAVRTVSQARNEISRLKLLGVSETAIRRLKIVIAPDLYHPERLAFAIRRGTAPNEVEFKW